MATHSSVLAWRIPGTGEPDGLPSMGLHRVGHDSSDLAAAAQHEIYKVGANGPIFQDSNGDADVKKRLLVTVWEGGSGTI